jgi:hypothetical protein
MDHLDFSNSAHRHQVLRVERAVQRCNNARMIVHRLSIYLLLTASVMAERRGLSPLILPSLTSSI